LFGDVQIRRAEEGEIWELEGTVSHIPFRIRVAWNYRKDVTRRWVVQTDGGTVIMNFLREEIICNGHIKKRTGGDKLREMVSDFLKGSKRRGSTARAMRNLEVLESLR